MLVLILVIGITFATSRVSSESIPSAVYSRLGERGVDLSQQLPFTELWWIFNGPLKSLRLVAEGCTLLVWAVAYKFNISFGLIYLLSVRTVAMQGTIKSRHLQC